MKTQTLPLLTALLFFNSGCLQFENLCDSNGSGFDVEQCRTLCSEYDCGDGSAAIFDEETGCSCFACEEIECGDEEYFKDCACHPLNAVLDCDGVSCSLNACFTGFLDCNQDVADGCEADLSSDAQNCGACGNRCSGECGDGKCGAFVLVDDLVPAHNFVSGGGYLSFIDADQAALRIPVSGGIVEPISSSSQDVQAMVADDSASVWCFEDSEGYSFVRSYSHDTSIAQDIGSLGQVSCDSITMNSSYVFSKVYDAFNSEDLIIRVSRTAGDLFTIYSWDHLYGSWLVSMVATDSYLFYSRKGQNIMRSPVDQSAPYELPIYVPSDGARLYGDGSHLYVLTEDQLVRADHNGNNQQDAGPGGCDIVGNDTHVFVHPCGTTSKVFMINKSDLVTKEIDSVHSSFPGRMAVDNENLFISCHDRETDPLVKVPL